MGTTKTNVSEVQLYYDFSFSNDYVDPDSPAACIVNRGRTGKTVECVSTVVYGDNIGDWRKAIRQGRNACTTLVGVKTTLKYSQNMVTARWTGSKCWNSVAVGSVAGSQITSDDPGGIADVAAYNQALSRLLSSYISAKNTWRGGNFLAEVGETIEMILHPVKSFYHATWSFAGKVKRLGKIYKKDPVKYGKALANAWLAFVFGVRPLIDDINDATSALHKLATGFRTDIIPIKGKGQTATCTVPTQLGVNPSGFMGVGTQYYSDFFNERVFDVKFRGAIRAAPETSKMALEQFGVGVFDVLPAVWEAIPWSFFIDYFANIGELIDSIRLVDADPAWLYSSVRNRGTNTIGTPYMQQTYDTIITSYSGGGAKMSVVRVERKPLFSIPFPSFQFKFPGLGSTKWLNIAALARQCYGSHP